MSSLFSQDISNQNQQTLFGAQNPQKVNLERKTSITSSLFNNDKPSIFGNMFQNVGNNEQQKNQNDKNKNTLFGTDIKTNIFENLQKEDKEKDSNNKNNINQGKLFKFDLFESPIQKENKENNTNTLFKSPEDKKEISKNLFQSNKLDSLFINNPINKEGQETKEAKEKEFKNNETIVNFGKKEEEKNNLFEISTSTKTNPNLNPLNSKNNLISGDISNKNIISTNQTSNKQSSSKRIEDNDEVQKALQNLYISDILLPNSFNHKIPSLTYSNKNIKNKAHQNKKSKMIDFKFFVEIKDIPNIYDEGLNIVCKSDESMSRLLKQAKSYVNKKYKMNKELNNFEIVLMKNGLRLPIDNNEFIGDYIKNNDKIIINLVHNSSMKNEEEKCIYIKNEKNDQENLREEIIVIDDQKYVNKKIVEEEEKLYSSQIIKGNNNPVVLKDEEEDILCPTDKLPILKREGYFMNPDEYIISRMTLKEIKNVENFSIFNENGKIEFEGKVSLYGANLDKLFNIEHEFIEYEKGEWCHSPRGQNFNIPAVITFYNIQPNIDITNENDKNMFIENLKIKCKKYLNATFISYNFENGTLIYKIPYFY